MTKEEKRKLGKDQASYRPRGHLHPGQGYHMIGQVFLELHSLGRASQINHLAGPKFEREMYDFVVRFKKG